VGDGGALEVDVSDKTKLEKTLEKDLAQLRNQRVELKAQLKANDDAIDAKKREIRAEENRKSRDSEDRFIASLEKRYGVSRNDAKFKKVFEIARERACSSNEFDMYFDEMADLLK
jgi:septal ring factor EnvC (AmiA/AmiB activator)